MTQSEHAAPVGPDEPRPSRLKAAIRQARIEAAERTGVVVDLRDADVARLELLNEALDPVFADIPTETELFDRGLTPGDPPRLWIDMIAHAAMGRDKRTYRFLQDTRHGRRVLAESAEIEVIVQAITQYIARRIVERERALAGVVVAEGDYAARPRRRLWRAAALFALGMLAGAAALLTVAWFLDPLLF